MPVTLLVLIIKDNNITSDENEQRKNSSNVTKVQITTQIVNMLLYQYELLNAIIQHLTRMINERIPLMA
jgi:hypothetical protein